jgi:dihydrofolate synthase/folylpolyglutamate synthase
LEFPALYGEIQLQNAASVLMVIELLQRSLAVTREQINLGLRQTRLAARFQLLAGKVLQVFDVAHNPQSAAVLAQSIGTLQFPGRTLAVFAIAKDKDINGVVEAIESRINYWYIGAFNHPRSASVDKLANLLKIREKPAQVYAFTNVLEAYQAALKEARPGDCVVVFGSFYCVGEILPHLSKTNV